MTTREVAIVGKVTEVFKVDVPKHVTGTEVEGYAQYLIESGSPDVVHVTTTYSLQEVQVV